MRPTAHFLNKGITMNEITTFEPRIGIFDMPNEDYHASHGISKTGLWTIYNQTPAHYRFGEREEKQHFDFGQAVHTAILEPLEFEKRTMRGPKDRRGNDWKYACHEAEAQNRQILIEGEYDEVLEIRDIVHSDERWNSLIVNERSMVEKSFFWVDEETGAQCRVRPDLYRPDLGIILDLKSTADASRGAFGRSVVNYGYHVQEPFYTDGVNALGGDVQGFVFMAIEKKTPFAKALYELPPSIVTEGRAIYRKALNTYAECLRSNVWSGYPEDVTELEFARWAYRETVAPTVEE